MNIRLYGQGGRVTARFVHQPFDDGSDLRDFLAEVAADAGLTDLRVAVAWIKRSGVTRVRDSLDTLRARGGSVELIVGIDEGGGTEQGLRLALEVADSAYVFHDPSGRTFHPKVYLAVGEQSACLLVGSHNLTAGGAYYNYEAGVVLRLDRAVPEDEAVVSDVLAYLDRLKADTAVCQPLDEALVTALLADPRYRVGDEDHRRKSTPPGKDGGEDDGDGVVPVGPTPLFGSASGRMRPDPLPRGAARPRVGASAPGAAVPGGSGTPGSGTGGSGTAGSGTGGSGTAGSGGGQGRVIRRWTKEMTRSDCGQPRPGSQTTGALRFTQADQPIDQATWARDRLFGHLPWQADARYPGREIVTAAFDITIHGQHYGQHQLVLKHDARRDAGQRNFTTDLKWAQLPPAIRQQMHVHDWVTVERHDDGTLTITVTANKPTLGFHDDPSV